MALFQIPGCCPRGTTWYLWVFRNKTKRRLRGCGTELILFGKFLVAGGGEVLRTVFVVLRCLIWLNSQLPGLNELVTFSRVPSMQHTNTPHTTPHQNTSTESATLPHQYQHSNTVINPSIHQHSHHQHTYSWIIWSAHAHNSQHVNTATFIITNRSRVDTVANTSAHQHSPTPQRRTHQRINIRTVTSTTPHYHQHSNFYSASSHQDINTAHQHINTLTTHQHTHQQQHPHQQINEFALAVIVCPVECLFKGDTLSDVLDCSCCRIYNTRDTYNLTMLSQTAALNYYPVNWFVSAVSVVKCSSDRHLVIVATWIAIVFT